MCVCVWGGGGGKLALPQHQTVASAIGFCVSLHKTAVTNKRNRQPVSQDCSVCVEGAAHSPCIFVYTRSAHQTIQLHITRQRKRDRQTDSHRSAGCRFELGPQFSFPRNSWLVDPHLSTVYRPQRVNQQTGLTSPPI